MKFYKKFSNLGYCVGIHIMHSFQALNVFNVVKFPNDACTSTSSNYNGTCYTATECKTLGGTASGTCASSFGVCCVFTLTCGQMSSQNNTYIEQATYTLGTDADPCTYKICPSGTVSKLKLEFTSLILTAPAGNPYAVSQ